MVTRTIMPLNKQEKNYYIIPLLSIINVIMQNYLMFKVEAHERNSKNLLTHIQRLPEGGVCLACV
jgi:hypothetical protein